MCRLHFCIFHQKHSVFVNTQRTSHPRGRGRASWGLSTGAVTRDTVAERCSLVEQSCHRPGSRPSAQVRWAQARVRALRSAFLPCRLCWGNACPKPSGHAKSQPCPPTEQGSSPNCLFSELGYTMCRVQKIKTEGPCCGRDAGGPSCGPWRGKASLKTVLQASRGHEQSARDRCIKRPCTELSWSLSLGWTEHTGSFSPGDPETISFLLGS